MTTTTMTMTTTTTTIDPSNAPREPVGTALRILADAWDLQRDDAFRAMQAHGRVGRLPDLSFDGVAARSAAARDLLARIDALDAQAAAALPDALVVALRQARYGCEVDRRATDWYWTVVDPTGVGFFGLFMPGAYTGGFLLNFLFGSIAGMRIERAGDFDRLLAQVADLAVLLDQIVERTEGQAARGMRVPRPQLASVRGFATGFKARLAATLALQDEQVVESLRDRAVVVRAELDRRRTSSLEPAFDRLAAIFDARYEDEAPDAVGMAQYADGPAIYRELVKLHTTLPLSPDEVHAEGLRRLATIEADMRALRAEEGLADDEAAYLARMGSDPRYRASTADGVAAVFQRSIDRMDAVFASAFHDGPRARHGVAPLPAALEGGMTFGYYDAPRPDRPEGRYLFNASHLTRSPLFNVAALTYHELVPGHHLHVAGQGESASLHPVSRFTFCNAFNEGWAEYAATLAGELGLYVEPAERYGRLAMDAFLTSRLVVDTGMNALGWSLEEARAYMRDHTTMTDGEIASETLRYSCDIPGQALAYKLGDTEIMRIRERIKAAQGAAFDLRDFHRAVLEYGALPLPDLAARLERATMRAA